MNNEETNKAIITICEFCTMRNLDNDCDNCHIDVLADELEEIESAEAFEKTKRKLYNDYE